MRSLIGTSYFVSRVVVAVVAVFAFPWNGLAQSSQTSEQPPELSDPTPRPIDLEKKYHVDPVDRVRQEQLALMRKAQLKQQLSSATDKLVVLAQELQADMERHNSDGSRAMDANKAHEIEKLAKSVKEKMQSQSQ